MQWRFATGPNQINFENSHFNSFYNESFSEDERDPDGNFFNEVNTHNFECSYLFPSETESFRSEKENSETINAIHVNIRSLSKNFDNLLDIIRDSKYSFNVICISETWCTDSTLNFDIISQERNTNNRGGSVLIYIQKNLTFNLPHDVCVSWKDKVIPTTKFFRENEQKYSPKLLL